MFKIKLFWHLDCVLMLNWIAWNRTVLTSKMCTYAKLNYLKSNCLTFNCVLPSRLGLLNTLTAPLQRGKTPPHECPRYDTKQSDGEVPVMLGPWGIWSALSLPLLPGPLWPGMVAPDRVLSMGYIEVTAYLC